MLARNVLEKSTACVLLITNLCFNFNTVEVISMAAQNLLKHEGWPMTLYRILAHGVFGILNKANLGRCYWIFFWYFRARQKEAMHRGKAYISMAYFPKDQNDLNRRWNLTGVTLNWILCYMLCKNSSIRWTNVKWLVFVNMIHINL